MQRKLLLLLFLGLLVSCEEILEVQDISEQQVELLAPTDQTVVTDSIVNFNWNVVDEANAYTIQIATPNFQNAGQIVLVSTMVVDSTFVGAKISQKLSNNSYEWRIKALNSDFETEFSISGFIVEAASN